MRKTVSLTITILVVLSFLLACAPPAPTAAPTKPAAPTLATTATAPAATTAPVAAATKPAAAAATSAPVTKIKRGGTARGGRQNDWETFNPILSQNNVDDTDLVYNTLVAFKYNSDTKRFSVVPELAESWDSKDPKAVIFKLRNGIKFHDGSDFNADAAKFVIDKLLTHPKSQGKENVAAIESAAVVDPTTVRINLKAPSASILPNLSLEANVRAGMISKAMWDKYGDDFGTAPEKTAGTGPMRLTEWLKSDHIRLQRFDGYWENGEDGKPLPYLDGYHGRFIADDSVRVLELRSGNIDIVNLVAGKDVPAVKANPDLVYWEMPWQGNHYQMAFNFRKGLFSDNLKLRQAALYAVDQENIAKTLGLGQGIPLPYTLGEGMLGYDTSVPKYTYDVAKAKQLLGEAGYPNGMDVELSGVSREVDLRMAQILKVNFDAINLRTSLSSRERIAWVQQMASGDYEFTTFRGPFRLDPDLHMGYRMSTGGSGNYAGWSNPSFDKCLEEGRSTYDEKQRQEIYKRCQTIVYEQAPFGFIWAQVFNNVYNKRLKGLETAFSGNFRLRRAWLDN